MKKVNILLAVILASAFTMASCGTENGDGPIISFTPESVTMSLDGTSTLDESNNLMISGTYKSTPVADGALHIARTDTTTITAMKGSAGVFIIFKGKTTGTFTVTAQEASALYSTEVGPSTGAPTYIADAGDVGGSSTGTGTVTVTEYGAVGGQIKGTYTFSTVLMSDPTSTHTIAGTFDVTRESDS